MRLKLFLSKKTKITFYYIALSCFFIGCVDSIVIEQTDHTQSSLVIDLALNMPYQSMDQSMSSVPQEFQPQDMNLVLEPDSSQELVCDPLTLCDGVCVDLSEDFNHCGACSNACNVDHGSGLCDEGFCVISGCEEDYFDDDGLFSNGCELYSVCEPNQSCTTSCNSSGSTTCNGSSMQCDPPSEVCNLKDDDCDDRCDENSASNGCRIPVHRGILNDIHLFTTSLEYMSAAGYQVDSSNHFYIYRDQMPGGQAIRLCLHPRDRHSLSTNSDCNGGSSLQILGFLSPNGKCGSRPLTFLRHPENGDYLYTRSEAETQAIISAFNFVNNGVIGHVWLDP